MKLLVIMFLTVLSLSVQAQIINAPGWTKDLVIYEISTKNFTSPNGPGTGTFKSTQEKIPYLSDLGINAIWLTGHSWSDDTHFYNIWTQYACIHPDSIDPTLGTPQEFKNLIQIAHEHDIKVFLDVITHGVMPGSPLIEQHPHWFKGGSWGMVDYDWYGGHDDLDKWWVDIWTKYVVKYGIDGFRLDVAVYRPDLWNQIRENAFNAGHPIILMPESNEIDVSEESADFIQLENRVHIGDVYHKSSLNLCDFPGFAKEKYLGQTVFKVEVNYNNRNKVIGYTNGRGSLKVEFIGVTLDKAGKDYRNQADGMKDYELLVKDIDTTKILHWLTIEDNKDHEWIPIAPNSKDVLQCLVEQEKDKLHIFCPVPGLNDNYVSVQLSCHDNGWQGFPIHKNPYTAKGSRWAFGYGMLLSPALPIFMSGEEWDAEFIPNPKLSPWLYCSVDAGKGRWLYGSVLNWSQLEEIRHADMLNDVKKMLEIRKREKDLIHAYRINDTLNILPLTYDSQDSLPIPYIQWNEQKAIIIVANPYTDRDINCRLNIPVEKIWDSYTGKIKLTNLWLSEKPKVLSIKELEDFNCLVKRDKVSRGGICVYKLEKE